MVPSDLSLRDLIFYHDEEQPQAIIAKVYELEDSEDPYGGLHFLEEREGIIFDCYASMIDASPIPISSEILIANGFKHFKENNKEFGWDGIEHFNKGIENGYVTVWPTGKEGIWHIKISITNNNLNVEIKAIHELQHALRVAHLKELADSLKIEKGGAQ